MKKPNHTPAAFDYESVPKEFRRIVQDAAREIRRLQSRTAHDAIELGKQLREVKKILGPAQFRIWSLLDLGWSRESSNLYIRAAEQFSHLDCLDRFHLTAMFHLGRRWVPEGIVQDMIDRAKRGEFITAGLVKAAVSQFKPGGDAGQSGKLVANVRNQASALLVARGYVQRLVDKLPDEARASFIEGLLAYAMELRRTQQPEPAHNSRRRSRELANV